MRKSWIKRIGKVGMANIAANKKIGEWAWFINCCEVKLPGCLGSWLLQPAHRNRRQYYKGDIDKLSDKKQVIIACQNCHEYIDNHETEKEEIFIKLRGKG